jgi:hypothetical protein
MSKRFLAVLFAGAAALPQTALGADFARANPSLPFAAPSSPDTSNLGQTNIAPLSPVDALLSPRPLTVTVVQFGGAPDLNSTSLSSELGTQMKVFTQ